MVRSQQEFYHTKAWERLISTIRQQREREDGFVYCEHCGKPIIKAYDCIGHHTIELTDENVNDAEIALNPELVMLVHHKCHNQIHNKLGYSERQVYLIYGSPLAGKTSYVESVKMPGDLIVDMDNIWQCISGMDRYQKPGRLNAVAFKVRDVLVDAIKTRLGRWQNAYIIGGYPYSGDRERLCKILGAREIYIDTSMEECMERLQKTEDSREKEEWKKYIEEWWRKYSPLP